MNYCSGGKNLTEIYDSIIIGAGPAGISTAIYNSRGGLKTALIERGLYGGTLHDTDSVENYISYENISGTDLAKNMEHHVKTQDGIDHIYGDVKGIDKNKDVYEVSLGDKSVKGRTIVIATGVKYKKLDIPGESKYSGRGVSNCITCDANFFRGKDIFIVGGGDSAVEGALYASNIVKSVTLVHRRDELRADKVSQDKLLEKENVSIIWDAEMVKFNGDDKSLNGITYKDKNTGELKNVSGQGAFINIGVVPVTEPFKNLPIFSSSDGENYIATRSDMRTVTMKGIYAVGDIREDSIRQIVDSVSDGAIASESILKYIRK